MKNKSNKIVVYVCSLLVLLCAFTFSFAQTASPTPSAENKAKKLEPVNGWFTLAPNIEVFSVEMPGLTFSVTALEPMSYQYNFEGKHFAVSSYPIYEREKDLTPKEHLERTGVLWWKYQVERFYKLTKKAEAEVNEQRSIELEGHPGREHKIANELRICVMRLYRTNNRLYILTVNVPVSESSSMERFFKSFTFKREKPLQFLEDPIPANKYPIGSGEGGTIKKPW